MGYAIRKKLCLIIVIVVILINEIGANQLEVAKKYGKRFGNKTRPNNGTTADAKETDKLATKALASDISKTSVRAIETTTTAPVGRQQRYSYSKIQTTTSSTTTAAPTTTVKADDQEEVDVDLSQLQVSLPNVKFDCGARPEGYYGDPDYRCEVFHYCSANGKRDTFLCPSNSKFNQKDMTCDTDAIEQLCEAEPAWGNNHLYPTQAAPSLQHMLPTELNNQVVSQEKAQIEVNPPKDNSVREPVFEPKTGRGVQTSGQQMDRQDNNRLKDNYNNNKESTEDNTNTDNNDHKYNYFGGTFGERQRSGGAQAVSAGAGGPPTAVNDPIARKNTNNNLRNNGLATDFGTAVDANKRGHKEENGNTNRAHTSSPRLPVAPVVVTLSTAGDTALDVVPVHQPFPSNTYSYSKPVIAVTAQRHHYQESTQPNNQMPSTAADKSFLAPPPVTDAPPSSVSPNVRVYSTVAHQPVHQNRPKWQNNRHEHYVTERPRIENSSPPAPPPQAAAPPRHHRPHKPPRNELEQRPIDTWPNQDKVISYEPANYEPVQQMPEQPVVQKPPSKQILIENSEIVHPNWSPVGPSGHPIKHQNNFKNNRPKSDAKHKKNGHNGHKAWNDLSVEVQRPVQTDIYVQNKDKVYNYPAVHHTINQNPIADNHLWASDDKPAQEIEIDYRPVKEASNQFRVQNTGPLTKPKWAQDLLNEMEGIPQSQAMTPVAQPLISLSSQPKKQQISRNRKPVKTSETFESLPMFEFNESDLFGLKPNGRPLTKQVTTGAGPVSLFYDQFKPYTFAENSPTEFVRKPSDELMSGAFKTKSKNKKFEAKPDAPTMAEEIAMEKEMERFRSKVPSYVPDLAEEEYPMILPETHMIPKLHKQKQKGMHPKHSPYRHKHPKSMLTSGVMSLDDLIAGAADQNWLKHLDGTAGLEAAFSHNYPMPAMTLPEQQSMSLPSLQQSMQSRHRRPHRFQPQDHNRFLLGAPIPTNTGHRMPHQPQPAFFIPPPMSFMSPLQAQATVPMPYYMPYVPQPQQSIRSQPTATKAKTNAKTKHASKSKSNSAPKIIRL